MVDRSGPFTICILPWLHLDKACELNKVCLVPFQLGESQDSRFDELKPVLAKILTSYAYITGEPVDRYTLLTINGNDPEWDIDDSDHERITDALSCFFLAAFSCNDYFTRCSTYANASVFQPVFQSCKNPPQGIAFNNRRRDGSVFDGGYDHGEVKISIPLECKSLKPAMDLGLLSALCKAIESDTPLARRLLASLQFLRLANTDQSHMSFDAEVVLMASSFEQLFGADNKYDLTCKYGECFSSFKSKTVAEVLTIRPGIGMDKGKEEEHKTWQLGRKFIQELYDLRSAVIHGEDRNKRLWGWNMFEHLVMGAYVYPLAAKLQLQEEGHYSMTDKDKVACIAIDMILSKTNWSKPPSKNDQQTQWQKCIAEAWWDLAKVDFMEQANAFVEEDAVPS